MLNSHYFSKKDNCIENQNEKVKKPNSFFFWDELDYGKTKIYFYYHRQEKGFSIWKSRRLKDDTLFVQFQDNKRDSALKFSQN